MWKRRNKSHKPIRTIPRQWETLFILLEISFGIGMLVDMIINIPLALVVGHNNSLLHNVIYFLSAIVTLFVLSYRDGRQNYQFKLGRLLIALLLTLATQVMLVVIIGHAIYLSGPSIVFDHYMLNVYNPVEVPTRTVLDTYEWILMFAADLFVYVPTMILGQYLGYKKRIKEFNESEESDVDSGSENSPESSVQEAT